jgi:hypothetical protein
MVTPCFNVSAGNGDRWGILLCHNFTFFPIFPLMQDRNFRPE